MFNEILTTCSPMKLGVISSKYKKTIGSTIIERINKEFTSDMKDIMETVVFAMVRLLNTLQRVLTKLLKELILMIKHLFVY